MGQIAAHRQRLNAIEIFRMVQSLPEEEMETLLLLLDGDLTREILIRREEAYLRPEELLREEEVFEDV